jgi:hypothetical protein
MADRPPRPRDPNQLAHLIVQLATGEAVDPEPRQKNPAAVALGKLGGKTGGKNRWKGVSKKKRTEITRKAVKKRWVKKK